MISFNDNETYLHNSIYETRAVVYHGNGPSKVRKNTHVPQYILLSLYRSLQIYLNNIANYVPNAWNETHGCVICDEWKWNLGNETEKWPLVLMAVFIETPTPFLQDMLERIYHIDYPKKNIYLWIHNAVSEDVWCTLIFYNDICTVGTFT